MSGPYEWLSREPDEEVGRSGGPRLRRAAGTVARTRSSDRCGSNSPTAVGGARHLGGPGVHGDRPVGSDDRLGELLAEPRATGEALERVEARLDSDAIEAADVAGEDRVAGSGRDPGHSVERVGTTAPTESSRDGQVEFSTAT